MLAVLPHDPETAEAVVSAAVQSASADGPLVFLYQGDRPADRHPELLEVADPYLRDRAAQVAFARAEAAARRVGRERHCVYVPADFRREAVGDVWKQLSPRETLLVDGDQDVLPPLAVESAAHVRGRLPGAAVGQCQAQIRPARVRLISKPCSGILRRFELSCTTSREVGPGPP